MSCKLVMSSIIVLKNFYGQSQVKKITAKNKGRSICARIYQLNQGFYPQMLRPLFLAVIFFT